MTSPDQWIVRDPPERIVCLVEEPTEILYALGEEDRIVGISAYTVRPERAAEEKPVVSAFVGGSVDKICALEPDLVVGFSDIQGQLAKELIEANQQVLIFNQRSIQDILDVVTTLGRLVGKPRRARQLADGYIDRLSEAAARTRQQDRRPPIYFEEWPDPQISAIRWVSQLIELAGGRNIFEEVSHGESAPDRYVDHDQVIAARPEAIVASWCGKPVDCDAIRGRPGYGAIPAVAADEIHELDPSIILQPGPACLSDGLDALEAIIRPLAATTTR